MKRSLIVPLAAAALVAAAMPSPAQAYCRGCAVGAGVIGGLAAGAIIGSAIANSQPRYAEPDVVYAPPPPAYAEPPEYVDGPTCHMERRQFWDGYAYRIRRVEVCD
jgi:hypothetical protein